jgi:hypothetical protein
MQKHVPIATHLTRSNHIDRGQSIAADTDSSDSKHEQKATSVQYDPCQIREFVARMFEYGWGQRQRYSNGKSPGCTVVVSLDQAVLCTANPPNQSLWRV